MFPGERIVREVDLLVDHLRGRGAGEEVGGDGPQVLEEDGAVRALFRRLGYVQLQRTK